MIDRESRDRLAEALRHYVSGQITNFKLDSVPIDKRDRGAVAVYEAAWGLYDDFTKHKATGHHKIPKDGKRVIARWISFLYSDKEYLWPEYSFLQIFNWPLNLITFGWWERMKKRKWEQFEECGDIDVWPFCSRSELEEVIKKPKLLVKKEAEIG